MSLLTAKLDLKLFKAPFAFSIEIQEIQLRGCKIDMTARPILDEPLIAYDVLDPIMRSRKKGSDGATSHCSSSCVS